jgi:hydrogenase maturation protease
MARGRVLVIGYGNPGRLDDGLGPRLVEALAGQAPAHVTTFADYSLQVEHAAAVAEHDVVVFADAAVGGPAPFSFERIEPRSGADFTTHSVSPTALLALAGEHFGKWPTGYVLGIRGCDFDEFGERLSATAIANLAAASAFLLGWLGNGAVLEQAGADASGG